jgi:uncharacterized protein DUF4241
MDWPNHDGWMALADDVEIEQDDRTFVLRVVDCGDLVAPSGRIVICDPITWLDEWALLDAPILQIVPGRYHVLVTQADVSGLRDGSHLRNAYATLLLSETPEVHRVSLAARPDGTVAAAGPDDNAFTFGVDTGTGCFVDLLAVSPELPIGAWKATTASGDWSVDAIIESDLLIEDLFKGRSESVTFARYMENPMWCRAVEEEDWWNDNVFESGRDDAWFTRLDDPNHLGANVANVSLPFATDGANFVIFKSGWGDGTYAVVGGYDAEDNLVRVHVDLQIVNPPEPFWLGRPPGYYDETQDDSDTEGTP